MSEQEFMPYIVKQGCATDPNYISKYNKVLNEVKKYEVGGKIKRFQGSGVITRDNTRISNIDPRYIRPKQTETNKKAYRTINPEASTSWLDSGAWGNVFRFIFGIDREQFGEKKNEDMYKFYLNGKRDTTSIPDLKEKPKNFSKLKHPTYGITDDDMYRINRDIISRDTNALKEDINSSDQRQLKAIRESHFNRNMGNDEEADRYKDEAERLRLSKEWKVQLLDSLRKFSKDPTKYMTFNEAYTNPSTWIPNKNSGEPYITRLNYLGKFAGRLTQGRDSLEIFDTYDQVEGIQKRAKGTPFNLYGKMALKDIQPNEDNDYKYNYY